MRIDVVTVFPAYLDPLRLSLPGRAVERGLVELGVHDLRRWTHDPRRTVDDAPYGGGAGMVMRPEPWGEALDALVGERTTVVVPTPAGRPFTQALAAELATREHLVLACGRYEGIDQRVLDQAATMTGVAELVEVSLGDYVLNGGEVAALAVVEAVVRLLPGVVGNPESLVEESHADGLLEYPVYTRPPTWRGHDVPAVLLGGDHAAVAAWRSQAARQRTADRRPDLLRPSSPAGELAVVPAVPADADELHVLTLACWVREALANDTLAIPALHESLDDTRRSLTEWQTSVVRDPAQGGRLVGSVRGRLDGDAGDEWDVGRLMVAPDRRGQGLGHRLLEHVLAAAPAAATSYRLFTGAASAGNQRMYRRAGFRVTGTLPGDDGVVVMRRRR